MFLGTSTRLHEYISCWFVTSMTWMSMITKHTANNQDAPCASGQMWRDWLHFLLTQYKIQSTVVSTPTIPNPKTTGGQHWERAKQLFTEHVKLSDRFPSHALLAGIKFPINDLIKLEGTGRNCVWELYELNFRLEFLALDRIIMPELWETNGKAIERLQELGLHPEALTVTARTFLPPVPIQTSSPTLYDVETLSRLQRIFLQWQTRIPWCIPSLQLTRQGTAQEWELNLLTFYCQVAFNHFGRAPILPHVNP